MSFLFDLDGTLVDSAQSLIRSINKVLTQNNLAATDRQENFSYAGHGLMHMFLRTCSSRLDSVEKIDSLAREMLTEYLSDPITGTEPYHDVFDVLHTLQDRGEKFAVITNKNMAPAKSILSTCFPDIEFDFVYSPDQGFEPKPSQMSILDFRKRHPSETLTYVGDTEIDWQTAEGVADKIFILTCGYRTREVLIERGVPESYLIDDIRQILD